MSLLEESMKSVYGAQDLASHPFFQGGFINFGYWKDIPFAEGISVAARISASKALYDYLVSRLAITSHDRVLEIGCGHGLGCRLVYENWHPETVVGVDLLAEQVRRAIENNRDLIDKKCSLSFCQGSCDALSFPPNTFTKIYTVEVAQHFPSVQKFLAETWRVIESGGRVGITTFFAESDSALVQIKQQIPEFDLQMNPISPIEDLMESASRLGYKTISIERIGQEVFAGFQRWVELTGCSDDWGPVWDKAYKLGLHDYFVVIFEKP